jgi:hypothetical protein
MKKLIKWQYTITILAAVAFYSIFFYTNDTITTLGVVFLVSALLGAFVYSGNLALSASLITVALATLPVLFFLATGNIDKIGLTIFLVVIELIIALILSALTVDKEKVTVGVAKEIIKVYALLLIQMVIMNFIYYGIYLLR